MIDDDMQQILVASDRQTPCSSPAQSTGKPCRLRSSSRSIGAISSGGVNALRMSQDGFAHVGAEIAGIVHAHAVGPDDVAGDQTALGRARTLGAALVA